MAKNNLFLQGFFTPGQFASAEGSISIGSPGQLPSAQRGQFDCFFHHGFLIKNFDVSDYNTSFEKLNQLLHELGGLDLLIISAGTGEINKTLAFNIELQTINTNVVGFTSVVNWAMNVFVAQNSGHLVAISSLGGLRGSGQAPSYNATKAFQINYLEALRQKVNKEKLGITVTDIRPGFVDTAMAKSVQKFWVAKVEEASEQIYNAIKNKRGVVYVTRRWLAVALILKLLPRRIYERL